MSKKIVVAVLFGEEGVRRYNDLNPDILNRDDADDFAEDAFRHISGGYHAFRFDTKAEAEAFKLGLGESQGWEDFAVLYQGEE